MLGFLPGKALIVPGVRYDSYKSESVLPDSKATNDARQFSPRIGVSYTPVKWLMVFANYADAFRAPTVGGRKGWILGFAGIW